MQDLKFNKIFFSLLIGEHMGSEGAKDGLRGKTLEVYRYLLKSKNPVGIREVQRSLDLSTPSLASYHLNKNLYPSI